MSYETLCVPRLRFEAIQKETGTRGHLYVMWCCSRQAFVAQTIPPMVKFIQRFTSLKLNISSFYRILRKEAKREHSKGLFIKVFSSVTELNSFLEQFELFIVISQNMDKWVIEPGSITQETNKISNGSQSP